MRGSVLGRIPISILSISQTGACLTVTQILGEELALSGLDPNARNLCKVTSDPEKCLVLVLCELWT